MTFDGAGNVVYEMTGAGGRETGYATYTVDPVAGKVAFTRTDPSSGAVSYTFVVGPNADLILGATTDATGGRAEVIVLAR
jgi:hypothetical protein